MLNRWLGKTIRFSTWLLAAVALTACGGGGGDGVGSGGFLGDNGQPDYVISISASNAAGDSDNQLSAGNPLTITVTLTRSNGSPLADEAVTLTSAVGTVSPANGSALTNANGIATFELTFDGTVGAGAVTATYDDGTDSVEVSLNIQSVEVEVDPAFLLELVTENGAGEATKRFSNESPLRVSATLFAVDGDELTPVEDAIITLESSIGAVDPSNGSTLTDANGLASFSVTAGAGDTGAGILTATFSSDDGFDFSRSQNIEVIPADQGASAISMSLELLNSAENPSSTLSADEPLTARVTLTSSDTNVSVAGRLVTLSSDVATVSPANGSKLTDSNGVADFLLEFGGTIGAGEAKASFSTDQVSLIETALLESTALELENDLSISLLGANGNASNILTNDSPLTVRVALTDRNGTVLDIDDEIVTLTSDIGTVSPGNGSALTSNGIAEFTLQFDGTVGAGVVTAAYTTDQGELQKSTNIEAQTDEESTYVLSISRSPSTGAVTPTNPVTVTVNLRAGSANGAVVAGEIIKLTSEVSDISPGNGAVITDANGNASFTLQYSGSDGAGIVEASFTSEAGNTFSNSINVTAGLGTPIYQINITSPVSGQQFDETGIDVIVNVTASANASNNALLISLTSDVGTIAPDNAKALTNSSGNASFRLTGDGTTGAGIVTAQLIDADGRTYEDTISVSMVSTGVGAGGTDPSKIIFSSASPETIALKGSGGGDGLSEQSTVVFKVTDSSGEGVAGQAVSFSLSTDLGGVALQNLTGTTDANGNVVAVVNSGNLPTPVRVRALTTVPTLGDISALSSVLNVSSGVPVATRFNVFLSADQTPCGASAGSTCAMLLGVGFDRFGNPAVDGTVVNFVTNCGGVGRLDAPSTGSCKLGDSGFGRCEMQWIAGNMDPNNFKQCANGASVEVMAYTLGEEEFSDSNGNAYFDATAIDPVPGSPPTRSRESSQEANGEPYLDVNGNNVHDEGEFFVDWNTNGKWDAVTTSSDDTTERPGPYPKAPPASPPEADDDLEPYGFIFYNGTACAERLDANGDPVTGSPNITNPSDGSKIVADSEDCSNELIYVWDTLDPLP